MHAKKEGLATTSHDMTHSKQNQENPNKKRSLFSLMSSQESNPDSTSKPSDVSRLMEGVVFVLSGFVNPERGNLRSQAIEMGAEYRPDWSSDCTLLVCAYPNTPKFRQVEADCGTIVKKEWITECYSQMKLVDIDEYIMHAGKPWHKCSDSGGQVSPTSGSPNDHKASPPRKSGKQDIKGSSSKTCMSTTKDRIMSGACNTATEYFSPAKIKKWASDDLNKALSWLESREEKPEPSEIKHVAAEGIIICIQDFIESLEQNQDVRKITEQWNIIPHALEELINSLDSKLSNEDICGHAKACKQIYEAELQGSNDDSKTKNKKLNTDESEKGGNSRSNTKNANNAANYDSDESIEMTEEEIDLGYNRVLASTTM